jgi:cholestenol delta-isomerase
MTRDPFVVCMESMTAFLWGPLSFVIGWCIIKDHPLRHPLQLIVSVGQLYGVILYYVTVFFDEAVFGAVFGRPEPYYFWVYFIGTNAFWFFIPLYLIVQSVLQSAKAFGQMGERRDYILMKTL